MTFAARALNGSEHFDKKRDGHEAIPERSAFVGRLPRDHLMPASVQESLQYPGVKSETDPFPDLSGKLRVLLAVRLG